MVSQSNQERVRSNGRACPSTGSGRAGSAVHDHIASWASENVLDFEYDGLQGGKPYREVGRVKLLAADRMLTESTDFVDGQEVSSMQVTLIRRQ